MSSKRLLFHAPLVLVCLCSAAQIAIGQTILFDLGNDLSYRGASVTNPDPNGNHWNSVWSGAFYNGVVDISGNATNIDFGFSSATGNDSYNGPAGDTTIFGPGDTVYDAGALGNLGVNEAVYDYYVNSTLQIQNLNPGKTYDLTFYGSHKYNDDNITRYTLYSDATFTNPIASVDLEVGVGNAHNQANVARLTGVAPQADNQLYIGFEGTNGGNGYLNAMRLEEAAPPPSGPKVYMHYMPWFDTPETLGANNWGLHWRDTRGSTTNPNIVDETGKRQIASNYYPKIGPYQSSNPHVIEYHMLLMKMAGVDGILIDWYGVQGANGDVGTLLANSNAIVDKMDDFEMEFGVVLEDRFSTHGINGSPDISKAEANVAYLRDHYFNRGEYIRIGAGNDPLLPVFGPITFEQESQWTQILAQANEDVAFLPLWYESGDGGSNSDGEYSWIYEDEPQDNYLNHLRNFYINRAPTLDIAGASAFPGFDVFGGANFEIPHDDGQTLASTLNLANLYSSSFDFLQLATWNDFGEGTIFEPTAEFGFAYLLQLQQFTGVPFGEAELQMVYRLYLARNKYEGNQAIQAGLDEVSGLIVDLNVEQARALLNTVAPAGDYDGDGDVDGDDYSLWRDTFGSQTILAGSGADGNYDGVVNIADYAIWRNNQGATSATSALLGSNVPEPATQSLTGIAMLTWCIRQFSSRGQVQAD
ncbi:hypothetical protein [Aeoliella sp.]|uniref:hypothetical protein n=1 Tax=Aeoliella sp. TaxID=2795800 RepID=UPI003CCBDE80